MLDGAFEHRFLKAIGIAMGNSMLSANQIGNVIVKDNDHDGVAEAIDKYITAP